MSKQSDMQKKTVMVPTAAGHVDSFSSATPVEGTNRFQLVPFAGQVFDHWYWGKMTFDVEGISLRKKVIPAFKDHDSAQFVGEIDSIEKKDGKVVLSGEFAATPAAETVKAVKKLDWECSLAFDMSSAVMEEVGQNANTDVNGAKLSGPAMVVRKAVLYETSFTFFGAVPGTDASFADEKKCVSVSIFTHREDGSMSDDLKKVREDAKGEALGLFQKMSAMCEDKAFVAECFGKSMEMEQFQSSLIAKQAEEITKLKSDLVEAKKAPATASGAPAVGFSAPAAPVAPKAVTFVEMAHQIAKDEKISVAKAFSQAAKENPALYQKHLEEAPVAKR